MWKLTDAPKISSAGIPPTRESMIYMFSHAHGDEAREGLTKSGIGDLSNRIKNMNPATYHDANGNFDAKVFGQTLNSELPHFSENEVNEVSKKTEKVESVFGELFKEQPKAQQAPVEAPKPSTAPAPKTKTDTSSPSNISTPSIGSKPSAPSKPPIPAPPAANTETEEEKQGRKSTTHYFEHLVKVGLIQQGAYKPRKTEQYEYYEEYMQGGIQADVAILCPLKLIRKVDPNKQG